MSTHHFLFCSSKDCINFHPENNSNDFIVELPKTLHLDGDWECALLDVTFENLTPGRSKIKAFSHKLSLIHNLPTDPGVEQTEWIDVRPVGSTSHGGVIEFNISGASTNYLDLRRTRLFLRARILHDDGTPLTSKETVGFVNLTSQSLWNQVDISIQQQVITPTVSTNYAYKSYMDVFMKYGISSQISALESRLFIPDSPGFMNVADASGG